MSFYDQAKGVILEEVVLYILRKSGYEIVEHSEDDPTLTTSGAGICVKGRACEHQIDAIADFSLPQPFIYPSRLLVEAKCYRDKTIGIDIIRNAVGVYKDLQEYWTPPNDNLILKKRYSYQFAVFSTTPFSEPAQNFAFAHDIVLVPLSRSQFFSPLIAFINDIKRQFRSHNIYCNKLYDLRKEIREELKSMSFELVNHNQTCSNNDWTFFREVIRNIHNSIFGYIGNLYPILLTPSRDNIINLFEQHEYQMRLYFSENGDKWYLQTNGIEFSFDLPIHIIDHFKTSGILSKTRALDLKSEVMNEITAFVNIDNKTKFVKFKLDHNWIEELKARR